MNNKNTSSANSKKYIRYCLLTLIIYLIIDYINLVSIFNINVSNLNMDIFCTVLNIFIIILLYIISFYYIDNKQNEKDQNATDIALLLIKTTYEKCINTLSVLDNNILIKDYISPSNIETKGETLTFIQNMPFGFNNDILQLARNGYIEKQLVETYIDIQKNYELLVLIKLSVAVNKDLEDISKEAKEEEKLFLEKISKAISVLN